MVERSADWIDQAEGDSERAVRFVARTRRLKFGLQNPFKPNHIRSPRDRISKFLKESPSTWFALLTISHPASSHRSKIGFGGFHKPAAYPSTLKAGVHDYVGDAPYLSAPMELRLPRAIRIPSSRR